MLRLRKQRDPEVKYKFSEEVDVEEWAREHAEEVETERQQRAQLRAGMLDVLNVTEEQLANGSAAIKRVLSSAVLDEKGEPFPDIQLSANSAYVGLSVYYRFDSSTPYGWDLWTSKKKPQLTAYPSECMGMVLGTELRSRVGFARDFRPNRSTELAAERLSDAIEFMVDAYPDVYDFEGAQTVIILPRQ